MVVSVRESHDNPYFNLFEEGQNGFLIKSKEGGFARRQDCPPVFAYNGAIYVININSLKQQPIYKFRKIRKYVMDEVSSVDLDTPLGWRWAEFLLEEEKF